MPEPPGGLKGLMQYLRANIQYPEEAQRHKVQGRVLVEFIVGYDGRIRDARVTQGIGAGCDEEALDAVRRMPPWTPGGQSGQSVKVSYTIPITFTLH
jgi:protein TonB